MARNIDIALLRSFVAIADRGSLSAAARTLHLTQGAVSQQLIRLETLLDERLVLRGRRGARLTAEGNRLLGTAREMLRLNDSIWRSDAAGRRQVRLGAPPDLVSERLPALLSTFSKLRPDIEVSLYSAPSDLLETALAEERIDLALIEQPGEALGQNVLISEPLVWIGAPSGTACRRDPLPISVSHEACRFLPAMVSALGSAGRPYRQVLHNEGFETTVAGLQADIVVTVSMASLIPKGCAMIPEGALPKLPSFSVVLKSMDRGLAARRGAKEADHIADILRQSLYPASAAVATAGRMTLVDISDQRTGLGACF